MSLMGAILSLALVGCGRPTDEVVVYTALDRNFSEPLFERFTEETGIRVLPKYDTEATKTIGLVNAIMAESSRPRCDVFWNNEIVNTVRLKKRDLLEPVAPRNAQFYPEAFRADDDTWFGFAARARVIIVNTNAMGQSDLPKNVFDLADGRFRGRIGIAKPLFGTTASHVACLFAHMGPERAKGELLRLKESKISIESGNKACAVNVARGRLVAAVTDTDDAVVEMRRGAHVQIVFPDSDAGAMGTLLIPNTLSLIRGGPHPEAGRKLINYLLSPAVEQLLADGESAQIPLNRSYAGNHPLAPLPEHTMPVDFELAAELFDEAAQWIRDVFLEP